MLVVPSKGPLGVVGAHQSYREVPTLREPQRGAYLGLGDLGVDMLSNAEIARMTREEREQLAHRLALFNADVPLDTDLSRRRRRRLIDLLVVTCLALIPWIVVLGLTLPRHYVANHWTLAWVGF